MQHQEISYFLAKERYRAYQVYRMLPPGMPGYLSYSPCSQATHFLQSQKSICPMLPADRRAIQTIPAQAANESANAPSTHRTSVSAPYFCLLTHAGRSQLRVLFAVTVEEYRSTSHANGVYRARSHCHHRRNCSPRYERGLHFSSAPVVGAC